MFFNFETFFGINIFYEIHFLSPTISEYIVRQSGILICFSIINRIVIRGFDRSFYFQGIQVPFDYFLLPGNKWFGINLLNFKIA